MGPPSSDGYSHVQLATHSFNMQGRVCVMTGETCTALLVVVLLLGPASSSEGGHCSKDGCPDKLKTTGDASAQGWILLSAISDTITSVKDTIQYNAYRAAEGVYNTTAEFAENMYETIESFSERVRLVFREEFNSFLEIIWESALGTNPANGSKITKFDRLKFS